MRKAKLSDMQRKLQDLRKAPQDGPATGPKAKRGRKSTRGGGAKGQRNGDLEGMIQAISRSQGVIEFEMDGTILTANDNFLDIMGYTLDEVQGQHHSIFADEEVAQSAEYKEFWATLNRGEFIAAEFKRRGKGGRDVWLQATYNPILDAQGKPA